MQLGAGDWEAWLLRDSRLLSVSLCLVALRVLDPILSVTKMYAVGETGGQTERGTDRDGTPHFGGSLGQGGEISKAGGAVGAGWREQDLPGVVQKQAELGGTSRRLSKGASLHWGVPTSSSRSPCPSILTLVIMPPRRTWSNYKLFPYSNPAG